MRFEVLLTEDTNRDLEAIYRYVAEHDTPGGADDLLDRIEEVIEGLSTHPERGSFPKYGIKISNLKDKDLPLDPLTRSYSN
jgi:toxin ParE1/3/4